MVLFSKAAASTLADKGVRDKVGSSIPALRTYSEIYLYPSEDIIISTPLRIVASLQSGNLDLHK